MVLTFRSLRDALITDLNLYTVLFLHIGTSVSRKSEICIRIKVWKKVAWSEFKWTNLKKLLDYNFS